MEVTNIIQHYFSDLTVTQEKQFSALKKVYEEWNSKINVISRKDMSAFSIHHVLHSLAIATQFDINASSTVMDLGCGGGFPGVPLAIFFPNTNFVLVDSINKKLKVVNEVCSELGIKNICTVHSRAEAMPKHSFDVVISRAVAPLKDLWKWSKPVLKKSNIQPNGLICLKGGDLTKEIFESGCKPFIWEIEKMFSEPYFQDKFLLYVKL